MKSYAKKIMTRLAAGAMALLLAVGTAATDMSVYAAETKTQESMAEKSHRFCRPGGQSERNPHDGQDQPGTSAG